MFINVYSNINNFNQDEMLFRDRSVESIDEKYMQPHVISSCSWTETESEYICKIYTNCILFAKDTGRITLPNIDNNFLELHISKIDFSQKVIYFNGQGEQLGIQKTQFLLNQNKYYDELIMVTFNENLQDLSILKKQYLYENLDLFMENTIRELEDLRNAKKLFINYFYKSNNLIRIYFKKETPDNSSSIYLWQLGKNKINNNNLKEADLALDGHYQIILKQLFVILDDKEPFFIDEYFIKNDSKYMYLYFFSDNNKFEIKIDKKNKINPICTFNEKQYSVNFEIKNNEQFYIKLSTTNQSINNSIFLAENSNFLLDHYNTIDINNTKLLVREKKWYHKVENEIISGLLLAYIISWAIIRFTHSQIDGFFIILNIVSFIGIFILTLRFGLHIFTLIAINIIVYIIFYIIFQKKIS